MTNNAIIKYNKSLDALHGNHMPQDLDLSFRLNQEAAEEGHKDAILAMGWFYLNSTPSIPRNVAKAKEWYKKSARLGEPRAMYSLGETAFYEDDYTTAKAWFLRALDKEHVGSHYMLGKMYWKGLGVSEDRKMARKHITEAATKGYKKASRVIRFITRKKSKTSQPTSLRSVAAG